MHNLYRITNKINNKVYIGQSIEPKKRFSKHKSNAINGRPKQIIQHALVKYGLANFEFEIIATCLNQADTDYLEEELIEQYNSLVPNGYNADVGGRSRSISEDTKNKISLSLKGHAQFNTGRTHFKEGQTPYNKGLSAEQQPRYGAKLTQEHILKLEDSNKKKRKLTEEQVKFIRDNKQLGPVALGRQFSISESCIRDILNSITYKS